MSPILPILLPAVATGFSLVAMRLIYRWLKWPKTTPKFLRRFVGYTLVTFVAWAIFLWVKIIFGVELTTDSIWEVWETVLYVPIILAGVLLDVIAGHATAPTTEVNHD